MTESIVTGAIQSPGFVLSVTRFSVAAMTRRKYRAWITTYPLMPFRLSVKSVRHRAPRSDSTRMDASVAPVRNLSSSFSPKHPAAVLCLRDTAACPLLTFIFERLVSQQRDPTSRVLIRSVLRAIGIYSTELYLLERFGNPKSVNHIISR